VRIGGGDEPNGEWIRPETLRSPFISCVTRGKKKGGEDVREGEDEESIE